MSVRRPNGHAVKPNERERLQRQALIDTLLDRALRGLLTIPEAAVLAEAWRAERRVEEKTRRSLADTTRALQRHREAADAEIRRLEERVTELAPEIPPEALRGPRSAQEAANGARLPQAATDAPDGRTGDPGELVA